MSTTPKGPGDKSQKDSADKDSGSFSLKSASPKDLAKNKDEKDKKDVKDDKDVTVKNAKAADEDPLTFKAGSPAALGFEAKQNLALEAAKKQKMQEHLAFEAQKNADLLEFEAKGKNKPKPKVSTGEEDDSKSKQKPPNKAFGTVKQDTRTEVGEAIGDISWERIGKLIGGFLADPTNEFSKMAVEKRKIAEKYAKDKQAASEKALEPSSSGDGASTKNDKAKNEEEKRKEEDKKKEEEKKKEEDTRKQLAGQMNAAIAGSEKSHAQFDTGKPADQMTPHADAAAASAAASHNKNKDAQSKFASLQKLQETAKQAEIDKQKAEAAAKSTAQKPPSPS